MKHPAFLSIEVSRWVVWLVVLACFIPIVSSTGNNTLGSIITESPYESAYTINDHKYDFANGKTTFKIADQVKAQAHWDVLYNGEVLIGVPTPLVLSAQAVMTDKCFAEDVSINSDITTNICDSYTIANYAGNGSAYSECTKYRTRPNVTRTCTDLRSVLKEYKSIVTQTVEYAEGTLTVITDTDSVRSKNRAVFQPNISNIPYALKWVVNEVPRTARDISNEFELVYNDFRIDTRDIRNNVTSIVQTQWGVEYNLRAMKGLQDYDPMMGGSGFEDALMLYFNYSETSGTNNYDETQTVNGTWQLNPIVAGTGKRGNGRDSIDGAAGKYSTLVTDSAIDWSNPILNRTINLWYNSNDGTGNDKAIWQQDNTNSDFVTISTDVAGIAQLWQGSGGCGQQNVRNTYSTDIITNAWYMLTLVMIKGKNLTLYVNGVFEGNQTWTTSGGNCATQQIGRLRAFDIQRGLYDEFAMWNRTLSLAEIQLLYNSSGGLFWVNGFNSSGGGGGAGGVSNYSVNSAGGNFSVIETELINFSLNLSYNHTLYPNVSCLLDYAGLNTTPCIIQHSAINSTGHNVTLYNVSMRAPIVQNNATTFLTRFNITLNATDQVRQNLTALNLTQTVLHAFLLQNVTFMARLDETSNDNVRVNVSRRFQLVETNLTLYYNTTKLYNVTNTDVLYVNNTQGLNWTIANKTLVAPIVQNNASSVPVQWQVTRRYANGSVLFTNVTLYNQSVLFAYFPQAVSAPDTTESSVITINATLRKNQNLAGITVLIDYNGTNQTPTVLVNASGYEERDDNRSINLISTFSENRSVIAYWTFSLDGNQRTTPLISSHIVSQIRILPCMQDGTNKTLNISFRHETTSNLLTMDAVTTFFRIRAATAPLSLNRTFGFNFTGLSNITFCKSAGNTPFAIDQFDVYYAKSGYASREFHEVTNPKTNFTASQRNLTLYTLETGNVTAVTITVIDGNDNVLRQYLVTAQVKDVVNNVFTTVDVAVTNFDGQVRFDIDPTRIYRFIVQNPQGVIVETTEETTIIATTFTIRIFLEQLNTLIDIYAAKTMDSSLNWTGNNHQFNLTWNDVDGVSSQVCLRVDFINLSNSSTLSTQCSSSKNSYLVYVIGNASGSYRGVAYLTAANDGNDYFFNDLLIDLTGRTAILGSMGILLALLLFGIMTFIGLVTQSVPVTLLFGTIGLIAGFALNYTLLSVEAGVLLIALFIVYIVRSKA